MRLSTRSRYGTRMMVDLARNYKKGPVQMREISKRQNLSVKYLEQLVIPLKRAKFITSVRGPKGGHMLSRSPEKITVGDIVRVLEGQLCLVKCLEHPGLCDMSSSCVSRDIWGMATEAVYEKLNSVTLLDMAETQEKQTNSGKKKKAH
ncbi:MAG: Rrf2 family transcriptional regulator [Deltaproteobacteria bacterium]|nr:Rrf2 family transcriptional regulator [Deltaproteobacteria bacterium]MBW2283005.1 Rrf2 family transcriptional regulator [Deltaproteobacteria bacterium]